MKRLMFLSVLFLPLTASADRLGSLKSSAQVLLTTQAATVPFASPLSVRDTLSLQEPIIGFGVIGAKIDAFINAQSTSPVRIAVVGDSVSYSRDFSAYLNQTFGFNGYEMGWGCYVNGSSSKTTGDYNNWISGVYYNVPSGSSLDYADRVDTVSPIYADTLKIYYIQEPGAGTFKVQVATGVGTSFTDGHGYDLVFATGTKTGKIITISKPADIYRIRVVGLSGAGVKILGMAAFIANSNFTDLGYVSIGPDAFAHSGEDFPSFLSVSTSIFNPVVASLAPDLLIWEAKESSATYAAYLQSLQDQFDAAYPTDWLYLGSTILDTTDSEEVNQIACNTILRQHALTNNHPFLNLFDIWGSSTSAKAKGYLSTDGVHPTAKGILSENDYIINNTQMAQFQNFYPGLQRFKVVRAAVDEKTSNGIVNPFGQAQYDIVGDINAPKIFSMKNIQGGNPDFSIYNWAQDNASWGGWTNFGSRFNSFARGTDNVIFLGGVDVASPPTGFGAVSIAPAYWGIVPFWIDAPSDQVADLASYTSGGTSAGGNYGGGSPTTNIVYHVNNRGFLGVTPNSIRGPIDVLNSTNSTVGAPSGLTISTTSGNHALGNGSVFKFEVFSGRLLTDGTSVYSLTGATATFTESGSGFYDPFLSWTAGTNANFYRVFIREDDYNEVMVGTNSYTTTVNYSTYSRTGTDIPGIAKANPDSSVQPKQEGFNSYIGTDGSFNSFGTSNLYGATNLSNVSFANGSIVTLPDKLYFKFLPNSPVLDAGNLMWIGGPQPNAQNGDGGALNGLHFPRHMGLQWYDDLGVVAGSIYNSSQHCGTPNTSRCGEMTFNSDSQIAFIPGPGAHSIQIGVGSHAGNALYFQGEFGFRGWGGDASHSSRASVFTYWDAGYFDGAAYADSPVGMRGKGVGVNNTAIEFYSPMPTFDPYPGTEQWTGGTEVFEMTHSSVTAKVPLGLPIVSTTTAGIAGALITDASYNVYIGTGTGLGAWVKVGGQ